MEFGPHLLLASLEGAVSAAVLALTAMGLSIVFGVMRIVNVAHGEFFMLGAVLAWWIASMIGAHPAVGFVVAIVIAPLAVGVIAAVAFMALTAWQVWCLLSGRIGPDAYFGFDAPDPELH